MFYFRHLPVKCTGGQQKLLMQQMRNLPEISGYAPDNIIDDRVRRQ